MGQIYTTLIKQAGKQRPQTAIERLQKETFQFKTEICQAEFQASTNSASAKVRSTYAISFTPASTINASAATTTNASAATTTNASAATTTNAPAATTTNAPAATLYQCN